MAWMQGLPVPGMLFQTRFRALLYISSYNTFGLQRIFGRFQEFLFWAQPWAGHRCQIGPSPWIKLWSSQNATNSGSSSSPKHASDELVDDNMLLKDFLVCHSSHILQPQALYIFHFDERTTWTWCAACFICIWNEELL